MVISPVTAGTSSDGYYPKKENNDGFKTHPMYSYFEALRLTADVDSIKIFNENTDNFKFNNTWWAAPSRIIVMEKIWFVQKIKPSERRSYVALLVKWQSLSA